MNLVILQGHLGADPELRHTKGGEPVCNMRVATTEKWRDRNGEQQERTEWHSVTVWGKAGEAAAKYLSKGSSVLVQGKNQTTSYEKDGEKRYKTEVVGFVKFLGGGKGGGSGQQRREPARGDAREEDDVEAGYSQSDDDIPF